MKCCSVACNPYAPRMREIETIDPELRRLCIS